MNLLFVNVIYTVTKPGFLVDACHPVWVSGIFFSLFWFFKGGGGKDLNVPPVGPLAGRCECYLGREEVQIVLIHGPNAAEPESELALELTVLDVQPSGKPLPHACSGFWPRGFRPGPPSHMCVELPRCYDAPARPPRPLPALLSD